MANTTRKPLAWALLALIPLVGSVAYADEDAEHTAHRIGTDLGNIETRIRNLQTEFARPVAESAAYDLEKRYIDARVYYDLKHWDKAGILLLDVVENPAFRANTDYFEAVFLLGDTLYRDNNFLAAKRYFEQVLSARGPLYGKALHHLIEIALRLGRLSDLEPLGALVTRLGPSAEPAVLYSWGKALYRTGKSIEALKLLAQVPPEAPEFSGARYYMGVVYTERNEYALAIGHFREAMAASMDHEEPRGEVREQAALAVGRLSAELGEPEAAIEAYQTVDRQSPDFEVALYEMAWVHAGAKRWDQALHTLDVLLLTVQDDELEVEASSLRARIQLQNEGADDAADSYKELVTRFTPVKNELEVFARSDANLASYFKWLLRRRADRFDAASPLSARAAAFVEKVDTMQPVIRLFDDMAGERADVKESHEIAKQLEDALAAPNRVEIFPGLQAGWIRIMEAENSLILLVRESLDLENELLMPVAKGDDKTQIARLAAERRALEAQFTKTVPRTVADYKARKQRVEKRFDLLKKETFVVEQTVARVREQLEAMDKLLNDARYSAQVATGGGERETELVKDIESEKTRLKSLYDELESVKRDIESQNTQIGAGDFVATNEQNIKNLILAAQRREHELYRRISPGLPPNDRKVAEQLAQVRMRVHDDFGSLGAVLARIQSSVDEKVASFARLVRVEKERLRSYEQEATANERDSDVVASEVGNTLFRDAQARVAEVVLEADLGLLDIAWSEKQIKSDRIAELNLEKSERLTQLQEALASIIDDETGPGAAKAQTKPAETEDEEDGEDEPEEDGAPEPAGDDGGEDGGSDE